MIGFIGKEAVGLLEMRVGRNIGSAVLIADGEHARVDGITLLAVIGGAVGSLLGFPLVDPIIGLLITIAILFITKDTAVELSGESSRRRKLLQAVKYYCKYFSLGPIGC